MLTADPEIMIVVEAFWDDEASVWVATSDSVPGLVTEAETLEVLIPKLRVMIPELLAANQLFAECAHGVIGFEIYSSRI